MKDLNGKSLSVGDYVISRYAGIRQGSFGKIIGNLNGECITIRHCDPSRGELWVWGAGSDVFNVEYVEPEDALAMILVGDICKIT